MGEHFVMSTRFDKCEASDFGLEQLDAKRATNPKDHTLWGKCKLYDFGWGKENGFYKERSRVLIRCWSSSCMAKTEMIGTGRRLSF